MTKEPLKVNLVTAVAGAGKTTALVDWVNTKLAEGYDPARISVVSFSISAAEEIRSRLSNPSVRASTIHSLAYYLCLGKDMVPGIDSEFYDSILSTGLIIAKTSRPMFDILAIDESQDMTPGSAEFLREIVVKCREVYIVGDSKQCIYKFMGADPQLMSTVFVSKRKYDITRDSLCETRRFGEGIAYKIRNLFGMELTTSFTGGKFSYMPVDPDRLSPLVVMGILSTIKSNRDDGDSVAVLAYTNAWRNTFINYSPINSFTINVSSIQHPVCALALDIISCTLAAKDPSHPLGNMTELYSVNPETWLQLIFPNAIANSILDDILATRSEVNGKPPVSISAKGQTYLDEYSKVLEKVSRECEGSENNYQVIAEKATRAAKEFIGDLSRWDDTIENLIALTYNTLLDKSTTWYKKGSEDITISTIHSAKGCQYDRVYVAVTEALLLRRDTMENVLYVALTRARKEVICMINPDIETDKKNSRSAPGTKLVWDMKNIMPKVL